MKDKYIGSCPYCGMAITQRYMYDGVYTHIFSCACDFNIDGQHIQDIKAMDDVPNCYGAGGIID